MKTSIYWTKDLKELLLGGCEGHSGDLESLPAQARSLGRRHESGQISELHRACCHPNAKASQIDHILRRAPALASKSMPVFMDQTFVDPTTRGPSSAFYSYPLTLAIAAGASNDVLSMLIEAAPSVLLKPDGDLSQTPLHVLLEHQPNNITILDQVLLTQSRTSEHTDGAGRLPIHTAILMSSNWQVLRHLAIIHPASLKDGFPSPLQLLEQRLNQSSATIKVCLLAPESL